MSAINPSIYAAAETIEPALSQIVIGAISYYQLAERAFAAAWRPIDELKPTKCPVLLEMEDGEILSGHFKNDGSLHWNLSPSAPHRFFMVPVPRKEADHAE